MKTNEKEVIEAIRKEFGEEALFLINSLKGKKDVSEIIIAEKCKKELNEVRSVLYKLHNQNIAFFTKSRDNEGWYTYYWNIDEKRMAEYAAGRKKDTLKKLKSDLKNEEGKEFFVCSNKCMRIDFIKAYEHEFKCPECNGFLESEQGTKVADGLKKEIEKLQK